MPSFDITIEPDFVEWRNAVDQANKEIGTRFDFKGSSAHVELTDKGKERGVEVLADNDFQLGQVKDVLRARLTKRNVDLRFLDDSARPERVGGDKLRQALAVRAGIDAELARKIQSLVKQSKLKVQASIQGDVVRIAGAKRDELQAVIALLKRAVDDMPLSFGNFRD